MSSSSDLPLNPVSDAKSYEATVRILDLLEKLAAVEDLERFAMAAGMRGESVREDLREAANMIRHRHEARDGSLDWRDMSVPEALNILADLAIQNEAGKRTSS